ncbi:MAG: thioredoxin family protein [Chloroflexota bacterium]
MLIAAGVLTARAATATSHPADSGIQALVTSNDLALGRNRFTFGLLDHNHPLSGGRPVVAFYYLHGNAATLVKSVSASFNYFGRGLPDTSANSAAVQLQGVYVADPTFARPGNWGAEFKLRYKGRRVTLTSGFIVRRKSLTPAVGSPAPRSNNPTVAQKPVRELDSGHPPDDMHRLSIAQAIAQHKPLVVLFSTPAFCSSRMCGPQTDIVKNLERRYRSRVNFVHVEIYSHANPQYGYAPTVLQWHLPSDPWVFVVNRKGIVAAKFEGPTASSEIESAIKVTLH